MSHQPAYRRTDKPKHSRCMLCGKITKTVSAVKAHIRLGHPGQREDQYEPVEAELVEVSPPNQMPPAQRPVEPSSSIKRLSIRSDGQLAGHASQQTAVGRDPTSVDPHAPQKGLPMADQNQKPLSSEDIAKAIAARLGELLQPPPTGVTAAAPQAPVAQPSAQFAGLSEATGQKLCTGIDCLSKSMEQFTQAANKLTGGAAGQPHAHGHDHGHGHEGQGGGGGGAAGDAHAHSAADIRAIEDAVDRLIACPDGVCRKALRRQVLHRWDELLPEYRLARKKKTPEELAEEEAEKKATGEATAAAPASAPAPAGATVAAPAAAPAAPTTPAAPAKKAAAAKDADEDEDEDEDSEGDDEDEDEDDSDEEDEDDGVSGSGAGAAGGAGSDDGADEYDDDPTAI